MNPIKANMSRLAGLRLVAAMGISFFVGLQFRHLRKLFYTNYYDGPGNDYLAIAPIELARGAGVEDKRSKQSFTVKTKRKAIVKKDEESEDEKQAKKKKRQRGPPARFNAGNYTKDFEPLAWSLPELSDLMNLSSAEFMEKYIAMKRENNMQLPWEQASDNDDATKLPLPVISLNFPKSATLTMRQFFKCGGVTSVHTSSQQGRLGICMMENMLADNPPMHNCDTHKGKGGKTDKIGFISDIGLQGSPCFYSSLHDGGLEAIAKHYPSSSILLVTRNATSWHRSIKKWGTLLQRWQTVCKFDGSHHGEQVQYWNNLYTSESKEQYWADFYNAHTQKIREFVMKHKTLTYVEVQLEDPKMGELLEYYTGIPSTCVMDCHPGPNWHKRTNATSKCHAPGDPMGLKDVPLSAKNTERDDDDDSKSDDNGNENEENEER